MQFLEMDFFATKSISKNCIAPPLYSLSITHKMIIGIRAILKNKKGI
jgi:hypothetical protein